jgi:hypothetical protein
MSRDSDKFDYSLIVIWFVALFTIVFGALWTRMEFIKRLYSIFYAKCVLFFKILKKIYLVSTKLQSTARSLYRMRIYITVSNKEI